MPYALLVTSWTISSKIPQELFKNDIKICYELHYLFTESPYIKIVQLF